MSEYEPQVGHRVHVEFDATVVRDDGDGTWHVHPLDAEWHLPVFVMPQHMTRLPDPEPEWKHGTVVVVPGRLPFTYDGTCKQWIGLGLTAETRAVLVTRAHNDGALTIVWTDRSLESDG